MSKLLSVMLLLVLLTSMVFAQPAYLGTRGLLRTISADNQGKSFLLLTFHTNYFQEGVSQQTIAGTPRNYTKRNANGYLSGSYAILDYVEISGGIGSILISDKDVFGDAKPTKFGFGDAYAGVKLSYSPLWFLKLGGYGFHTFATGSSVLKDSLYTSQKSSSGAIGLITLDLSDKTSKIPFPVRIIFNGGFLDGAKEDGGNKYLIGTGVCIPAGLIDLFCEASSEISTNSDIKLKDNPMRITPGIRFWGPGAVMDVGVEIGLGNIGVNQARNIEKLPWKVLFGVSLISRIKKEKPLPIFADVTGKVTDIETNLPVKATITTNDSIPVTAVDDANGIYRINLESGAHNIIFSADGYNNVTKSVVVKDSLGIALDAQLAPLTLFGTLDGKVTDASTGLPLGGRITFRNSDLVPINVNSSTGVFSKKVPVGNYVMEIELPGYIKKAEPITIIKNQNTQKDFALDPTGLFGTVTGKVSDAVTLAAVGATIKFPKTNIQPIDVNPTNGVYSARLPVGNYAVEVEANGYNKNSAAIIITKNETIQKDFSLKPIENIVGGKVAGNVLDAITNQGIDAKITVVEKPSTSVMSATGTGSYSINLNAGTYNLTAEKTGYLTSTQIIIIKEKETTLQQIVLKPIQMAIVTGKVTDVKTKSPLKGTISFPNTNVNPVIADVNGIFKVELSGGTYTIKAEYEGFIAQAFPIVLENGKTVIQNFELLKHNERITLRGIYFDFDKSTIKPESYPVLNDAVKILKDNPTIRVRIEGHTDSVGSDSYNQKLSQRRADAVKSYLVKTGGFDSARIESVGKGEGEPIASNDTDDGRSLNRRIEFVVIGE